MFIDLHPEVKPPLPLEDRQTQVEYSKAWQAKAAKLGVQLELPDDKGGCVPFLPVPPPPPLPQIVSGKKRRRRGKRTVGPNPSADKAF